MLAATNHKLADPFESSTQHVQLHVDMEKKVRYRWCSSKSMIQCFSSAFFLSILHYPNITAPSLDVFGAPATSARH